MRVAGLTIVLSTTYGLSPTSSLRACVYGETYQILDANMLCLTVEAVREYILLYERHERAPDIIRAFALLCAIKREHSDVAVGILEDQKIESAAASSTALPISIESTELALRFIGGTLPDDGTVTSEFIENTLFLWTARKHRKIAAVLLGHKGVLVTETELEHWLPPEAVASHGLTKGIDILLSEGIDKDTRCNG